MSNDAKFIPGLFFKPPHDNAPDFVMAKGSIRIADLSAWLAQQPGEWVNFDLKKSRDGKPYASVDDWKPNQGQQARQQSSAPTQPAPAGDFADDDIPF